jgi:arylsulfatase A-like enzyme
MVNRHYAIVTKKYKLIHYYFQAGEWELIDREKDPLELKNVYDDPDYASIRRTLHRQLADLRLKYKDNTATSDGYIDRFLNDAAEGKVFGIPKEKAIELKKKRK